MQTRARNCAGSLSQRHRPDVVTALIRLSKLFEPGVCSTLLPPERPAAPASRRPFPPRPSGLSRSRSFCSAAAGARRMLGSHAGKTDGKHGGGRERADPTFASARSLAGSGGSADPSVKRSCQTHGKQTDNGRCRRSAPGKRTNRKRSADPREHRRQLPMSTLQRGACDCLSAIR